ncbi:MAG TPA: Na+/H+ antiporter [Solirubrobacteraceae bacterium]|nr:Na+/H+ antiporter [Solirubrobacteraceae bacterium]
MGELEFLFVLLLAAAAFVRLADVIRIPYPIVLVLGGLGIGLVPGLPDVRLDPEVVFLVFLPPLLASAGFATSPQELRAERRALAVLTIGLVLATMVAVAVVAHEVVEGLSWAAAFTLGAIVAPTDPVAALATFGRAGAPDRVARVVEGEAMLNDSIGLVAFRIALGATLGGTFDLLDAAVDFVVSALGGIAVGLAAGWLERRVLKRLSDRPLAILWTVLVVYAAYIAAEQVGVSGVLAAVVTGLYIGWYAHDAFDADTRLSAIAFWEVLTFALNALVFILLGLQFPAVTAELRDDLSLGTATVSALAVAGTVIAVRLTAQFIPGARTADDWRRRLAVGWSGMRGAISLAAALSIPFEVEARAQIVFITFVVILTTLVGQGLTLPLLLASLGLRGERVWSPEEAIARLEAAQAALDRIDELEQEGAAPEKLRRLREVYRARFRQCQAVLSGDGGAAPDRDGRLRYGELRRELIAVERAAIIGLRDDGRLRPDVLRLIERDLDLEEARLSAAA